MASQILGAVLAGGRSRRFGTDKATALLDGEPLIGHAIAALQTITDQIVICGRRLEPFVSLADRPEGGLGPLAGLNAALHHAATHRCDGVLVIGCDMPKLPAELARALVGAEPAIVDGHHLIAYWPASLAPLLDEHLAETKDRSIRSWLARVEPRRVSASGYWLPNINTPADLADAMSRRPG